MSMTLFLWKAPVVDDPDEAEALLKPYYDRSDEGAFEASADVAKVSEKLLQRFPEADDGPWADFPPREADRLLILSIRWGADNAVIDAIVDLAREHELVLYDPQGPDIHLPSDPTESEPLEPLTPSEYLKFVPIGLAAAGVFWLGWWIDVPVLGWLLMLVGGFFVSVVVFMLWIFIFEPKKDEKRR